MQGVFLDLATVSRDDLDLSGLRAALNGLDTHALSDHGQTLARVADAEVIITNKIRVDAAVIAAAPRLKLVCLAATGHNNVDLAAASEAGVAVTNVRDYCTAAVAQHVFALILALNQHLAEYQQALADGAWRDSPQFCLLNWPLRELAGQRLGIIGHGVLGRAVARLGEAFGMEVLLAQQPGGEDRRPGRLPLNELLPQVDVLSLHCPLTPATRHLIDADALKRMRPQALLINTARGAIVDSAALAEAIRAGWIGGAGIDVLSQEPPIDGDPLLELDHPRLILTPHIAWASREARQRAVDDIAANVRAFVAGRPRNLVS